MEFGLTSGYKDIFKQQPPSIESLLHDIPSKVIIKYFSLINAQLFVRENPNSIASQEYILSVFVQNLNVNQHTSILKSIYISIKQGRVIFTSWYITKFIEHQIANYRNFDFTELNVTQLFKILQAYCIIIDLCNDKHLEILQKIPNTNEFTEEVKFEKASWPILAEQFCFQLKIDPLFQISKSFAFYKELQSTEEYSNYVNTFLKKLQRENLYNYLMDLLSIVKLSYQKNNFGLNSFAIIADNVIGIIFDLWSINVNNNNLLNAPKSSDLKMYPLYKDTDDRFFVLNWGFLFNKMYEGQLHLFYELSGIKDKYLTYIDFKSYHSHAISEKIHFRGLLKSIFNWKYKSVVNTDKRGYPDFYYRDNNSIYIFEFKDSMMPSSAIMSFDSDEMKEDLNKKFIGNEKKPKGVLQLYNQLININKECYPEDDFSLKIKRKNIIVYPIIVYTNYMYSMPGVNEYLNKILKGKISTNNNFIFREIKDLVMIDFDFFYNNFIKFKEDRVYFKSVLDKYLSSLKKAKSKNKNGKIINYLKAYSSFNEFNTTQGIYKKELITDEVFSAWNIKEH